MITFILILTLIHDRAGDIHHIEFSTRSECTSAGKAWMSKLNRFTKKDSFYLCLEKREGENEE